MATDPRLVEFAMQALGGRTNADRSKVMEALANNPMLVQQYTKRMSPTPVDDQPTDMNALESTIMRSLDHAPDAPAQAPKPKAVAKQKAPVNVAQAAATQGRDGQGPGSVTSSPSDEEGTAVAAAPASTDYGTIIKQILTAAGIAGGVGAGAYGAYRYANRPKQLPDDVSGGTGNQLPARTMQLPTEAVGDPEFQKIAGLIAGPDTIQDADFREIPQERLPPTNKQLPAPDEDTSPNDADDRKRVGAEDRKQITDQYSEVQKAIDDTLQEDDAGKSRENARSISEEARKAARSGVKKAAKKGVKAKKL